MRAKVKSLKENSRTVSSQTTKRQAMIEDLREANEQVEGELTTTEFEEYSGFTANEVIQELGPWNHAKKTAFEDNDKPGKKKYLKNWQVSANL